MVYLIQGVFFQSRELLDFDRLSEGQIGILQCICHCMYAGVLNPAGGDMIDSYGTSILYDINVGESEMSFRKKYLHRDDTISYVFRKQADGTWKGKYSGIATGEGRTSCVLTQVADEFFAISEAELAQMTDGMKR